MNYFINNFELILAFVITQISLWVFDMSMGELMLEFALFFIGLKLIRIQIILEGE